MIKCFVVKSNCNIMSTQTRGGFFIKNKAYIAKINNEIPNTISVLDENYNWISYNYTGKHYAEHLLYFKYRFEVQELFYVKNKKVLSDLIHKGLNSIGKCTSCTKYINRTVIYGEILSILMEEIESWNLTCVLSGENKIPCMIQQISIEE